MHTRAGTLYVAHKLVGGGGGGGGDEVRLRKMEEKERKNMNK